MRRGHLLWYSGNCSNYGGSGLTCVSMQLSQILNYRNEDMLVKSNDALRKSGDAMREIALAAKAENELMSALLGKSQRDSRTVKVLTYIALIYLPASLVAVSGLMPLPQGHHGQNLLTDGGFFIKEIFNSNLVQTINGNTETTGARLVLAHSFWLYPCITLGLMVLTLLPIMGLLFHDRLILRRPAKHLDLGKERG